MSLKAKAVEEWTTKINELLKLNQVETQTTPWNQSVQVAGSSLESLVDNIL